MPFDDLLTPVVIPAEQRHDAATCCGERHVTECRSPAAAADETSQAAEQPLGAYLNEENDDLRQQVAALTAEVERLRSGVYGLSAQGNAMLADALVKAANEVERLRLTDQEMKALKYFANSNWTTYHPLAIVLDSLLRRWGIVI